MLMVRVQALEVPLEPLAVLLALDLSTHEVTASANFWRVPTTGVVFSTPAAVEVKCLKNPM